MHHHSLLLSTICKCAYLIGDEDRERPVLPSNQNKKQADTSTSTTTTDQKRVNKSQAAETRVPLTIRPRPQDNRDPSPPKKGKIKRRVTIASQSSASSSLDNSGGDESDWPPFADEDYIVFCFEEDGEFHVVTEDSYEQIQSTTVSDSNSQQVDGHNEGHSSSSSSDYLDTNLLVRRDWLLPNKAIEEERFYFSPRLQSEGIKSSTRFKDEGGYQEEEIDMVKARNRVEEDIECQDDEMEMDGIKNRGEINEEQEDDDDMEDIGEDNLDCRGLSLDCHNGSVESTASSVESDTIFQQQQRSSDLISSPPHEVHDTLEPSSTTKDNGIVQIRRDGLLPNDMVDEEEESIYLSSDSQQNDSRESYEEEYCSDNVESEDETATELDDTRDVEQEYYEQLTVLSITSNRSDSTASSFEFPVLQCEWTGSPVRWSKSATVRLRKQKSRRVCLRCCKF